MVSSLIGCHPINNLPPMLTEATLTPVGHIQKDNTKVARGYNSFSRGQMVMKESNKGGNKQYACLKL